MNLLYIFADQWRRDAIGIYDKRVITPNMDKFVGESVVFDRAYSSCPLCSPHRGCLLTGKYPVNTNVFTNCKPDVNACLREDDVCVSDILKSNGYTTGYIGKWHLDRPDGSGGWDAYTPPAKKGTDLIFGILMVRITVISHRITGIPMAIYIRLTNGHRSMRPI